MAFQAVPETAEVDIRGRLFGQKIESTLYFTHDGGWTDGDLADVAAMVRGWFFANVLPHMSQDYTFQEVFAQDLSSVTGHSATDVAMTGTAGGIAQAGMPGNVALAVSFRTGLAGRSYRGRNYVSGLAEGQVVGNSVDAGEANNFATAYNTLIAEAVSSDFTWVVVSRVTAGVIRAVGVTNPVITAVLTDFLVDSMRRRLTGRGQ